MKLTHARAVFLMVAVTLMWSIAGVVTRQLEQARSFERVRCQHGGRAADAQPR